MNLRELSNQELHLVWADRIHQLGAHIGLPGYPVAAAAVLEAQTVALERNAELQQQVMELEAILERTTP